jgi:hypothetical protein
MESYLEIARQVLKDRRRVQEPKSDPEGNPLEDVLKGLAVELWSDVLVERFWLVADEADAARIGEARGTVYTAAEARRVVQIGDPAVVAEIHQWKRRFDGVIRDDKANRARLLK